MAQNKEQLEALLQFIDRLAKEPGNEWFVEKLRERYIFETYNAFCFAETSEKLDYKVSKIEKYLALDYDQDSASSTIDYSKIEDTEARKQLESDNREMMRYRYGTRAHKIDFTEFCKYAHFQAEMLMNYLYEPFWGKTMDDCIRHILKYNPKGKEYIHGSPQTVTEIPYATKLYAFNNEFSQEYKSEEYFQATFNFLRKMRNENSHRGESTDDNEKLKKWYKHSNYDQVQQHLKLMACIISNVDRVVFL